MPRFADNAKLQAHANARLPAARSDTIPRVFTRAAWSPRPTMNAGATIVVTDWDKWMFKRTWTEMRALKRW